MIIRRARVVPDIVLITTPSYELGFRQFNNSRVQNEKIYNHAKDVVVTASHVIGDVVTKVDSIDLNGATRNTTYLRLFCFTLRDQAIDWLDRLPVGSISTWDDLTTRESLYDAWNRFEDLLQKVPHHGLDLWLQVQIFYDHVNYTTQMAIDDVAGGRLRKVRPEEA
ncbi:hypothetical protein Tco_0648805 [Tanacetum coccineum]